MFNLSGSELIFLVLIALVVLGPDKLPDAMRKAGKAYADFKRMTTGFQSEMKSVLEEPMRELRETAELAKRSAMIDGITDPNKLGQGTPQEGKPQERKTQLGNPQPGTPSEAAPGPLPEVSSLPKSNGEAATAPVTPVDAGGTDEAS